MLDGFESYPTDPQDFISAETRAAPLSAALAYAAELTERYRSLRDADAACRDVVPTLPPGRWVIYGAGTAGAAAAAAMAMRADMQVVGHLDRRAAELVELGNRPVFEPAELPSIPHDFVLVAHHTQEMEMRRIVQQIAGDRALVFGLFESAGGTDVRPRQLAPFGSENVVVTTIPKTWTIISDEILASIFGTDQVPLLYFGRNASLSATAVSNVFPVLDCAQSLPRLRDMIVQLSPRCVYLRTSAHAEGLWLAFLLKLWLPEARIISETYDWSVLLRDDRLRAGFYYTERDLRLARFGEWFSTQCHDLLISKQGGVKWDSLAARFVTPHTTYFPVVGTTPASRPAPHVR